MVLRFRYLLPAFREAQDMIDRACRDLCNGDFVKFGELKKKFHIMNDLDLYIDDDMPNEEAGYILKCLRAKGFCEERAEVIVPCRYWPEVSDEPVIGDIVPAAEEDDIIDIEDLLPPEAFDDGRFEEEYEEALNMNDDDDDEEDEHGEKN